MFTVKEIEKYISDFEQHGNNLSECVQLASLYTVRDHLRGYSISPEANILLGGSSEFLRSINGKESVKVWEIMDELMSVVQTLHPAMYDKIIKKIKDI